jgi:hypothetical protein
MNLLEIYMRVMRPFNQPYFSMLEAYAGFLRYASDRERELILPGPAVLSVASPRSRTVASAAIRDATKKELAETVQQERCDERAASHSVAVERSKRAWATRRANAASDKKAARAKSRARKAR